MTGIRTVVAAAFLCSVICACSAGELSFSALSDNEDIFVDNNRDGVFTPGTDVRIFADLMMNDSGGSESCSFDTSVPKGNYTPLMDGSGPAVVDIVIPSNGSDSSLKCKNASKEFVLRTNGNLVVHAGIESVGKDIILAALGGEIQVAQAMLIRNRDYGIIMTGGYGVILAPFSSVEANGPDGKVYISASTSAGDIQMHNADVSARRNVTFVTASAHIDAGSQISSGGDEAPSENLPFDWGKIGIHVYASLVVDGAEIHSQTDPAFDPEIDMWPIWIRSRSSETIHVINSDIVGYTVFEIRPEASADLSDTSIDPQFKVQFSEE